MDAQADLSLRWAHSHFVGFVMLQLIYGLTFWSGLLEWGEEGKHITHGMEFQNRMFAGSDRQEIYSEISNF